MCMPAKAWTNEDTFNEFQEFNFLRYFVGYCGSKVGHDIRQRCGPL